MARCKSCQAEITWIATMRGKKMPVDGAVTEAIFDAENHVSHWDTCPDAASWRGTANPKPGFREITPANPVEPKPLRLDFGSGKPPSPEQLALWAARAAAHQTPVEILERVGRIRIAARLLLRDGWPKEELQAMFGPDVRFRVTDEGTGKDFLEKLNVFDFQPDAHGIYTLRPEVSKTKIVKGRGSSYRGSWGDKSGDRIVERPPSEYPQNLILRQFTGITDADNRDIYAGDVLRDEDDEDRPFKLVYWDENDGCWRADDLLDWKTGEVEELFGGPRFLLADNAPYWRIVANIWEPWETVWKRLKEEVSCSS